MEVIGFSCSLVGLIVSAFALGLEFGRSSVRP